MIRDREVADEICKLLLAVSGSLDGSVELVQKRCSEEEFVEYRRGVARVLGEMYFELLKPLYAMNPTIKPPELE